MPTMFAGTRGRTPDRHTRRGATIVLIVFILPILILILGFSVDLAQMQRVRTELRVVADLAAKAAAEALSEESDPEDGINAAIAEGKAIAAANRVTGSPLTLEDDDFIFGRTARQEGGAWEFTAGDTPHNAVRVRAKRTSGSPDGVVKSFFGWSYGRPTFEAEVRSTASFMYVDVCLVLDRSSSMKLAVDDPAGYMRGGDERACKKPQPNSRWVALDAAVQVFLNQTAKFAAHDRVAVVTFGSDDYSPCGEKNTDASVDQDLTADETLVKAAMNARSNSVWNGNTLIDRGIQLGQKVLTGPSSRAHAQKIMILFTDGVYTGPDPVPFAEAANAAGITVHTITFSDGANQEDMQAVAAAANGEHFHAPDAATLNEIFRELAGRITILTE